MPRSRRAAPARAPAPAARAPPPAAPPPPSAPPPMAAPPQQSGGMLSGMAGMVAQGMAIGTGSAIAHHAVDGVMGAMSGGSSAPTPAPQQAAPVADACISHNKAFQDCLQQSNGEIGKCQFYHDMLNQCKAQA
mmetsp:Transcript_13053/g.24920  ORF Transcript_13053/g.24920 Transcript_13053/m.24920 type:complete len:133 (+) Transcript_13053:85-483(+)|eukprot:CAMPEP_0114246796 /NCGR_PEP_ID=MMETSP0058-20121206/12669_1 /TAXON_ID=36894 /ORGANISM="Pyramimonas parkeae, CCMP726" /LENGTH=132 /DNA_ID=CAMNT_0001360037 /DNA_START=82 /DNA_END=480 /DNA_ORIENTATION=-